MARRWFAASLIILFAVECYEMPVDGRTSTRKPAVKPAAAIHATSNLADDGTVPITIDLLDVKMQDGSRINGKTLIFLYNLPAPEHEVARCTVVNDKCSVVAYVPRVAWGSYGFSILPEGSSRQNALTLLIQQVKVQ